MNWMKEVKAAQQRRVDKIARNKKLDAALKTAFESGHNADKQNALAYQMGQLDPQSLSGRFLSRQQQAAQASDAFWAAAGQRNMAQSLGLGGIFGGALHITP